MKYVTKILKYIDIDASNQVRNVSMYQVCNTSMYRYTMYRYTMYRYTMYRYTYIFVIL